MVPVYLGENFWCRHTHTEKYFSHFFCRWDHEYIMDQFSGAISTSNPAALAQSQYNFNVQHSLYGSIELQFSSSFPYSYIRVFALSLSTPSLFSLTPLGQFFLTPGSGNDQVFCLIAKAQAKFSKQYLSFLIFMSEQPKTSSNGVARMLPIVIIIIIISKWW